MDPTLVVPPGVTLVEFFRIHHAGTNTHLSTYLIPPHWGPEWTRNGTLGFISRTPFENSVLIWQCWGKTSPNNIMTSTDPNCEGQYKPPGQGPLGYVSTVQLPGTIPLYRCSYVWQSKLRHFDSIEASCEGNAATNNDGILGYVFL